MTFDTDLDAAAAGDHGKPRQNVSRERSDPSSTPADADDARPRFRADDDDVGDDGFDSESDLDGGDVADDVVDVDELDDLPRNGAGRGAPRSPQDAGDDGDDWE